MGTAEVVGRAADALRSGGPTEPIGRELAALTAPGRVGEIVQAAAELLVRGPAPGIPVDTARAVAVVALDDAAAALAGKALSDPDVDSHLAGLRSLAPIRGVDFDVEFIEIPADAGPVERPSADLFEAFQIEARDLLTTCEGALLELEGDPTRREAIASLFRALHSFKGNCGFLGLGEMEQLAHAAETLLVEVKEGRLRVLPGTITTLLTALDALRGATERATEGGAVPDLATHLAALARVIAGVPPAEAAPAAIVDGDDAKARTTRAETTLRVDVSKVDQLLDLVGELIIASTAVRHLPESDPESLQRASAQLDRVVRSLQDVAMSLRMVPVGPTFQRMVRVVRDVSQRLGKAVELEIDGEDTEIDKTVAELVTDPLVHIVRNALDHGIESPEARVAAGKPRAGRLRLSGSHVGGEVWVRVEDDGRGLDRQRILARAIERGLADPATAADLPDADVFAFVFEPGFSTAEVVTDVSGRGVGMDVVRKNLDLVKGRVDIRSTPGQGAAFTLRIPLTLAIIEGMLVRVGRTTFTVPLLCIRESVRVRREDVTVLSNWQELVRIRGELLPVVRMHRMYGIEADRNELHEGILVVVEDGGSPLCLFVDELIGQRQTVIKALSGFLGTVRGIAGCTVLGDGRISLILDVPALVRVAST